MNFRTPKLDAAVADFKALCAGHPQMFTYGQFYVLNRTIDDLKVEIESALRNNVRLMFLPPGQLDNAVKFFNTKLSQEIHKISVAEIAGMLDLIEVGGDMASIRAMLPQSATDAAEAQTRYNTVWGSPDIQGGPVWFGRPTLGIAQAAHQLEKVKCFDVLRAFARKAQHKRGVTALPATVKISEGAVAGAHVSGPPAGGGDEVPQQLIKYTAPLSSTTARIKAALDAKAFVHCGLLSGASHERSAFPQPEHHVLVFGYDTINVQDAFVFWDPDTARSNIASTGWGFGFGVLFASATRLSTAFDDGDLTAIQRNKHADTFGDHVNDTRRHCYQVYFVQTLPA